MKTTRLLACIPFVAGLLLAISCSDDEGDNNGNNSTSGTGGTILATGGTAGNSAEGGNAGSGNTQPDDPLPACEELEGLDDCGESKESARIKTPNLLLVIDKSGSMEQPIDADADEPVTKWSGLRTALGDALGTVDGDMGLGLILYPHNPDSIIPASCSDAATCCQVPDNDSAVVVPMTKGSEGVNAILAALDNAPPGGGTPTALALERAYYYYTAGPGADLKGEKYVLLATDGGPNCNLGLSCPAESCTANIEGTCTSGNCCENAGNRCVDDSAVSQQINALRNAGVETFVVGIPGTEVYADYLNQFAVDGGRPNENGSTQYYAASSEAGVDGLTSVFRDISTQLVRSCEIPLSEDPGNPNFVNVAIDCVPIPKMSQQSVDGEGGQGGGGSMGTEEVTNWHIDQNDSEHILILEGELCDRVQNEGALRVDIVVGCPPIT